VSDVHIGAETITINVGRLAQLEIAVDGKCASAADPYDVASPGSPGCLVMTISVGRLGGFDAAQCDLAAAAFLLDERIPLDDRFEVAAQILCPGPETARTVH
jgi:hypothetical protein